MIRMRDPELGDLLDILWVKEITEKHYLVFSIVSDALICMTEAWSYDKCFMTFFSTEEGFK